MLEYVSQSLVEGEVALIAVIQEEDETLFNTMLHPYQATVIRYNAAEIAEEIETAANMQWEMEKTLRKQLREEKTAQRKENIERKKQKIKKEFEELKEDWNDNIEELKDKLD